MCCLQRSQSVDRQSFDKRILRDVAQAHFQKLPGILPVYRTYVTVREGFTYGPDGLWLMRPTLNRKVKTTVDVEQRKLQLLLLIYTFNDENNMYVGTET
jgi:hypothetical protein